MKDRFHIGEEAAEAQGTWNRGFGKRQMREEEEQEMQDEADSLMDQRQPPGILPGIQSSGTAQPDGPAQGILPGIGAPQPPPQPNAASMPQMDPGRLAALMSNQPPPQQNTGLPGFSMPPAMPGMNVDLAELQKQLVSQGVSLPPNLPAQGFPAMSGLNAGGLPGLGGGANGGFGR